MLVVGLVAMAGDVASAELLMWTDQYGCSGPLAMCGAVRTLDLSLGGSPTTNYYNATEMTNGVVAEPYSGDLYWIESGSVRRMVYRTAATLASGSAQSLAIDSAGGKLYWHIFFGVRRANLDGSGLQDIVTGLPGGNIVALHLPSAKVYWDVTNTSPRRIDRANLDGTGVQNVMTLASPNDIAGIATDPVGNKLYWSSYSLGKIVSANLDGTSPVDVITSILPGPIAVDGTAGKIYWINDRTEIRRANLNGTSPETVVPGLNMASNLSLSPSQPPQSGDFNCDGQVNGLDIAPFVLLLIP